MSDLTTRFNDAVAASKTLSERPDNMTLLKMYSLYKQGSQGDASGERPGMTDFVARAKWDAWQTQSGKSREQAMEEYVALYDSLKD
ncbi:acyl-CoA-binding protein [Pigmentiphaga litoralis]|uniref:Acyl-CoA-binding protein n=1 Tax=Pigmentiphaga litoralis TaxID=516702 RepID=A0A7Y9IYT4_9BURK|nr:acyl-CoA-binding protein [Pigmentiphaga litoralis]NYE26958.1 acyl-CoA-binding protein [Pigmentiphaga litoralis]NYE85632.1 acyl-CoA-binding protein [Pigmentiphaga litoralis]